MRPAKRDIDDSVGSPLDCAHRYRRIGWGLRGTVRSNQAGEGADLLAEYHDILAGNSADAAVALRRREQPSQEQSLRYICR